MRMRRLWRAVGALVLYGGLLLGMAVAFMQAGSTRLAIGQGADPGESAISTTSVPMALYADAPPFRAVGDGASHPLAQRYQSLAAAQADYPHVTDLSDEIDWAAIQRAMDHAAADGALGAKVVLAANRRYVLNRTLRAPQRLILEGGGSSTMLLYTGTGTALEADPGTGSVTSWHLGLQGFTLRAATGTRGIALRDVADVDLRDIAIFGQAAEGAPITGFREACLYLGASRPPQGATIVVRIRNVFFQQCRGDGIRASEANAINQIAIHQARIQGNQGWGINFQVQARALDIQGSDIEGNAVGQVQLAGVLGLHFAGNYLESAPTMIDLTGGVETRGVVIEGNHMQGSGAGVTPTAIKLGGGAFPAEGVVIKGNWITAVTHALDLRDARGVDAGANSFTNVSHLVAPTIGPQTRGITGIPLPPQSVKGPETIIHPWGELILLDNSMRRPITLTSIPTLEAGMDQQVIRLLNISPYGIVLQDQGTLAKSNLRLTAAKITLGPQASMTLVYLSTVGAWVQSGPVISPL
jgi:hypothetical protein